MSTLRRKRDIERLRLEGRAAFEQGRSIQTCPREYTGTMNRYQWEQGYLAAEQEDLERRERDFYT